MHTIESVLLKGLVYSLLFVSSLSVISCDFMGGSQSHEEGAAIGSPEAQTVEWTDLIPEADLEALLNPPEYLFDIAEGSAEDQRLFEQLASGNAPAVEDRYQQALLSTNVRDEFDGRNIRIAGFLVPLEFSSAEVVTQAFLVPYFGACIHVPPPPPNQIILLSAQEGVSLDDMYNPYWVSGKLSTTLHENELGTSAYQLKVAHYELYTE